MRVKEMFANIQSFDHQMNSPCQNQKKHKEEFGLENMDNDVRV